MYVSATAAATSSFSHVHLISKTNSSSNNNHNHNHNHNNINNFAATTPAHYQADGECNDGYHCCHTVCYSCNCHRTCNKNSCTESCSTCCYCASEVYNQARWVERGTCYTPTVTFSYALDGNGDGITSVVRAELSESCGLDDHVCPGEFLGAYPAIGEQASDGYYNPANPGEIALSVVPSDAGYGAAIAFAILYARQRD